MNKEIKKDRKRQVVVIITEPFEPKYLPNNPAKQNPVTDKNITNRYIY